MLSRFDQQETQLDSLAYSQDERQRYHDLCASLRPTNIVIPSKEARPAQPAYRAVLPSNSNDSEGGGASLVFVSNLYYPTIVIPEDRIKTPRTPQNPYRQTPRTTGAGSMGSMGSSLAARSLDSAVGLGPGIGLRGLATVMEAPPRTTSPTDEQFFETHDPHLSPSELLVSKYKAKTPKRSDFHI